MDKKKTGHNKKKKIEKLAPTLTAWAPWEPLARSISCLMMISLVKYASWRIRSDSLRGTSGMHHAMHMVANATTFWKTSTKARRAAKMYQ